MAAWVAGAPISRISHRDGVGPVTYRNPKNRKALQKVFSNDKPKLLGFVSKVHLCREFRP